MKSEESNIKRYYFSLNDMENNVLETFQVDREPILKGKSLEEICSDYDKKFRRQNPNATPDDTGA
ncbi:MAG: hypothetical protein HQL02_05105 [Nitrospirae bacterium]|nr:hypothetical protein [Nitrospirota bacterium]